MIARFHYEDAVLDRFLVDDLSQQERLDVSQHIENCDQCQSQLESLSQVGLSLEEAGELLRAHEADHNLEQEFDQPGHSFTFLRPSDHPQSMGRFGRYEIMEVLGRGGMGIVMRGFDPALNRYSAIKVLAPELATSAAARKRFSREAKSAAAVIHAHVVPIQTVDEEGGLPYLVMPVVEGRSVQQRVSEDGPLEIIEAVRIGAQIAQGLAAAHDKGLVHRDVKPANILLENSVERVQLTDFGLARAADDASMTRSGIIAGTPQYMSPEQAHGDEIDGRSDLFSLGSVMYFMLTGHSPFRAETTMGVLSRIANDRPRPLRSINTDVPKWLDQLVNRLLAKERTDRPQTAHEVAEILEGWEAHLQAPSQVTPPIGTGFQSPLRAIPGWAKFVGAAAGLLLLASVIFIEMGKGTIKLETNSDVDIPIRILRGDKTVRHLTLKSDGTYTRLSAGEYVIVVDGDVECEISGANVTLTRRGEWLARITVDKAGSQDFRSQSGNGIDRPVGPPKLADESEQAIARVGTSQDILSGEVEPTSVSDRATAVDVANISATSSKPAGASDSQLAYSGLPPTLNQPSNPNDFPPLNSNRNLRRHADSSPLLKSIIEVSIAGDDGIQWVLSPNEQVPLGFEFNVDNYSGTSVLELASDAGQRLLCRVRMECADAPTQFWSQIRGQSVQFNVTHGDFQLVSSGQSITKLVYLAPAAQDRSAIIRTRQLAHDGDDSLLFTEVKKHGQLIISVRLAAASQKAQARGTNQTARKTGLPESATRLDSDQAFQTTTWEQSLSGKDPQTFRAELQKLHNRVLQSEQSVERWQERIDQWRANPNGTVEGRPIPNSDSVEDASDSLGRIEKQLKEFRSDEAFLLRMLQAHVEFGKHQVKVLKKSAELAAIDEERVAEMFKRGFITANSLEAAKVETEKARLALLQAELRRELYNAVWEDFHSNEDLRAEEQQIQGPYTAPAAIDEPGIESPTTESPTTESPTTESPTTESPNTESPNTEVPNTDFPNTEASNSEEQPTESSNTIGQ